MKEHVKRIVEELDAKGRRVNDNDVLMVSGNMIDSTNDVYSELNRCVRARPEGKYKLVCVHCPEPDGDLSDADFDRFYEDVAEAAGPNCVWISERTDDPDANLGLYFSDC